MHLPLEKTVNVDRLEESRVRALLISDHMRQGSDRRVRKTIENFDAPLEFENRKEDLAIASEAWDYITDQGIEPKTVFAHPDLLCAHPEVSLHYRGISTLSLKRVQLMAGQVASWEDGSIRRAPSVERCLSVARTYNAVISVIITGTDGWTLQNGYRNILATIGITQDGVLRNIVGQEGETAVKQRILEWIDESPEIDSKRHDEATLSLNESDTLRMIYGSEPDIRFESLDDGKEWSITATIEIKSGTDPAGALERLGAIEKSFAETPVRSSNYAVLGVVTPEMRRRLEGIRIAEYFLLYEILNVEESWDAFVNDVFHHGLRLVK